MKQYHVAGRDMTDVAEAVRLALVALPDEDAPAAPKKARKPRRTKAEMAQSEPTVVGKPTNGKRETVGAGWPG